MTTCAAIIAGGASRRMGTPKALLELNGEPLIRQIAKTLRQVFPHIIVVTGNGLFARAAGAPAVPDVFPERGVLGGLHAALHHFKQPAFCVACDMPFLRPDVLQFLAEQQGADAFVPRIAVKIEPLHAVYTPALVPVFEAALSAERPPPMRAVLEDCNVRWLDEELRAFDADLQFLTNWNTPGDLPTTVPAPGQQPS